MALSARSAQRSASPAPHRTARALALGVCLALAALAPSLGCGGGEPTVAVPGAASASPKASAPSTPPPPLAPGAFVRECTYPLEDSTDECACLGGYGAACGNSYTAEEVPVVKRWLLRMIHAQARLTLEEVRRDPSIGVPVPHAEIGMFCKESGPCGGFDENDNELDGGYACLTAATGAWTPGEPPANNERLARACRCGAAQALVPVMGGMGVIACSEAGAPMAFGGELDAKTAAEIRACAECDAERGRKGCEAELARLAPVDMELAKYVADVHARRCQRKVKPPVEGG